MSMVTESRACPSCRPRTRWRVSSRREVDGDPVSPPAGTQGPSGPHAPTPICSERGRAAATHRRGRGRASRLCSGTACTARIRWASWSKKRTGPSPGYEPRPPSRTPVPGGPPSPAPSHPRSFSSACPAPRAPPRGSERGHHDQVALLRQAKQEEGDPTQPGRGPRPAPGGSQQPGPASPLMASFPWTPWWGCPLCPGMAPAQRKAGWGRARANPHWLSGCPGAI